MHALTLSKTPEHYTPADLMEIFRGIMGGIDLDPCSTSEANRTVKAAKYYNVVENGLSKPWAGRVYINPPGDPRGKLPKQFFDKLYKHVSAGDVSEFIWLAFNAAQLRTLQWSGGYFLLDYCDLCILEKRIRFTGDSPTKDNAVLYYGPNRGLFREIMREIGKVWFARFEGLV